MRLDTPYDPHHALLTIRGGGGGFPTPRRHAGLDASRVGSSPLTVTTLRTDRLVLRDWTDDDVDRFVDLHGNPEVTEFLPGPFDRQRIEGWAHGIRTFLAEHGWGLWAIEVPGRTPFAGFTGLSIPAFHAPFTPCTEAGWRLAREHWGRGYATEAARAAVAHGLDTLGLDEIVSFTVPSNRRSRAVMERIGLRRVEDGDFDHPALPAGHPLRAHVLYRIRRGSGPGSTHLPEGELSCPARGGSAAPAQEPTMSQRPFRILGLQQIAVGGLDKGALRTLWIETLGLESHGSYQSEKENVDEDIATLGSGPFKVEVDLMQPIDPEKRPKVHEPSLNHVGLWVDDLAQAVAWLTEQGMRFTPGGIRKGAAGHDVCFIHPKGNDEFPLSGAGVLIELVQAPADVIEAYGNL